MEESRCVTLRGKLGLKDPVQNFEEAGAMEERIQKNRFPVSNWNRSKSNQSFTKRGFT